MVSKDPSASMQQCIMSFIYPIPAGKVDPRLRWVFAGGPAAGTGFANKSRIASTAMEDGTDPQSADQRLDCECVQDLLTG